MVKNNTARGLSLGHYQTSRFEELYYSCFESPNNGIDLMGSNYALSFNLGYYRGLYEEFHEDNVVHVEFKITYGRCLSMFGMVSKSEYERTKYEHIPHSRIMWERVFKSYSIHDPLFEFKDLNYERLILPAVFIVFNPFSGKLIDTEPLEILNLISTKGRLSIIAYDEF